jgi:hypothetical protein
MTTLLRIWHGLGSTRLALWLLAAVAALFFTGSVYYGIDPEHNVALNTAMLFDWLKTNRWEYFSQTWWFFLLLGVLTLLGVNTGICTLERTAAIIRSRRQRSRRAFLFLLAPHILHMAFLVIITGYLALYTTGLDSRNHILKPGFLRPLPGSAVMMELRDPSFTAVVNPHNESLTGLHVAADFTLLFHEGGRTEVRRIGLNSPCFYKGYSIHVMEFNPKWSISVTKDVWVNLTIRKSWGIALFMAGIVLFAGGVFLYAWSAFARRQ